MIEAFDVVVVGYGLAGAVSAIEAHDAGAKVLLIEKEPFAGGISICAGGGARIADDAEKAFSYLKATNAATSPEPVLMALARGMVELEDYVRKLAEPFSAVVSISPVRGNCALTARLKVGTCSKSPRSKFRGEISRCVWAWRFGGFCKRMRRLLASFATR